MFDVGSAVIVDYGYTHVRSPHPSGAFRLACLIVGLLLALGLTLGSLKPGVLVPATRLTCTLLQGRTTLSWGESSGSMASGSPLNLQALIRNAGAGNALAPFNLSFYVDGSYVGSRSIDALASGASSLVTLAWPAAAGNHTLSVKVDEEGSLPETSETNNSAQTSFGPLSLLYSDLLITSFTLTPETAAAGETVLARVTVRNIGDAATLSGFDVLITLDGAPVALLRSAGSLTAGTSAALEGALRIECPQGPHTVTAALDSAGLIAEKSESNNTATTTLETTGVFTPDPAEGFTLSLTPDGTGTYDRAPGRRINRLRAALKPPGDPLLHIGER